MTRDDITVLGHFWQDVQRSLDTARARTLMKNTTYVGVLAALLEMDMGVIEQLLLDTFGSKTHLIEANKQALEMGHDYAKENFECPLKFKALATNKTKDHFIIDGNATSALGCLYARRNGRLWYPITPSTSLMDAFSRYCAAFKLTRKKKRTTTRLSKLKMSWQRLVWRWGRMERSKIVYANKRSRHFSYERVIGFGYYAEIPTVIFDVQRTGPSTGMPTRTQQCDILSCAYASHGDTKHVCIYPANPEEAFTDQ